MRKFKADYINLILFFSVIITLIFTIVTSRPTLTLEVILILTLVIVMGLFFAIISFKDYCIVELGDHTLRIKFILRGKTRELNTNDIEGIIFQDRNSSRGWRSWKEIIIKTKHGERIPLSKERFFNFYDLEKDLQARLTVLVPSTEKILTSDELKELKRKNYHLEIRGTRKYLIVSFVGATIFILFSISGTGHSKGWPVILLIGIYFLYSFFKNVFYFRKLKKEKR